MNDRTFSRTANRVLTSLVLLSVCFPAWLGTTLGVTSIKAAPTIGLNIRQSNAAPKLAPETVTLSINNNSFENANLSGWTVSSGHVEVLQSNNLLSTPPFPTSPTDGTYMAMVCNGPGSIDPAEMNNLDGDPGPNNDNDRSILSQAFTVGTGDTPLVLEFDWNWMTSEGPTPGNFDDFFMVTLNSDNILSGSAATAGVSPFPDVTVNNIEYTVNSTGSTNGCFFNDGQSGWKHFSYVITTPGVYTLSILVSDQGNNDHAIDTGLLVDNFQVARGVDLKIQQSASPNPVVLAGEELLYTVTVDNMGPGLASSVVVTDTLPANVLYMDSTGSCSEVTDGKLSCPLGDLAAGESHTFAIKTLVPSSLTADETDGTLTITNRAGVSSVSPDINPDDNTFSLTSLVQDLADLRVTKVIEPEESVQAGQTLTYTVFVDNLGPSYARNVKFTDRLLSSGYFSVVTIFDDPNRTDSCVITPGFGTPTLDSSINCTLMTPLETVGSNPSLYGRWMVKIILRPTTASDITGVTDVFSVEDIDGNPGTPDPDLSNNQAVDFVPVRLTADLQDFSVFAAEVQTNGLRGTSINTNSLPTMPDPICCNYGGTTVTAGRRIQWDTSATNVGPSAAQNARIEVSLPYGASLIENTLNGTPNPGNVPGRCYTEPPGELRRKVICEYGSLGVGASAAVRFQVLIDPSLPAGTQLSFESFSSSETFDSNLSNNITSIQFDVNNSADLAVQKYGNSSAILAGSISSYDVTYQHKGPSTARNVTLTDLLPSGITPLGVEIIDGSLTPTDCLIRTGDPALVDSLVCELGDLLPGATGRLVLKVLVKPDTDPGLLTNMVTIASITPDPYPSDNTQTFDSTIGAAADLGVVKTGDPDKVEAGGEVKFTLEVTNHGPSDAHSVVVTDTLPLGMFYETSNLPGPTKSEVDKTPQGNRSLPNQPAAPYSDLDCQLVSSAPDVVSCTISTLQVGETRVIEIYALVDPNALPGVDLVNYAEVTSQTPDPDLENNQDNATTYVLGVDLSVSKTAYGQILVRGQLFDGGIVDGFPVPGVPDQVTYGLLLTYTLTISNQGYTMAQNVVVTDKLPAGVSLMSLAPSQGRCTPGVPGNPAFPTTCNLGSLGGGSGAKIIIVVRVSPDTPAGTFLANQAQVSSDQFDPKNNNDIDFNFTKVIGPWWPLYLPFVQVEPPTTGL